MPITFYSKPRASLELQVLTHLNSRMNLSPYQQLLKNNLPINCIKLFDLLLESNETEFQIDSALIFQNTIFMNEVKNFKGDFIVKEKKWYAVDSRKEVTNPMLQLQRSEFLLRKLLQQMGVNFEVIAQIIFVNPSFTLYQAPYDQALIFPTQLKRYMQKLNNVPSMLTAKHTKFAKELVGRTIKKSPRERLPKYEYDQLQKGIICPACSGFMSMFNKVKLRCLRCGYIEDMEVAVMRSVTEINLLFPEKKITTATVHEWCKGISSKKVVRRILTENMTPVRNGKYSFYLIEK